MKPERIQKKGLYGKIPEGAKYVGRPSKWGNPFKVSEYGREKALELYREYLEEKIQKGELNPQELKGLNLACFCRLDEACHADILLELANVTGD